MEIDLILIQIQSQDSSITNLSISLQFLITRITSLIIDPIIMVLLPLLLVLLILLLLLLRPLLFQ